MTNVVIPPYYKRLFFRDVIGSLLLGTAIGGVWLWHLSRQRAQRRDFFKQLNQARKEAPQ